MIGLTQGFHRSWVTLLALLGLLVGPGTLFSQDTESVLATFPVPGTVIDADDGTPLQYAVVGIPELGAWALSEADGSFNLEVTSPGIYSLVVVKRGWYLLDTDASLPGQGPLEIQLFKEQEDDPVGQGRLVGRVFDESSGNPVSKATVRITPTDQTARTDSRGRFIISGISAGAVLMEIERRGTTLRTDTLATLPGVTLAVEIGLSSDPAEKPDVAVEVWPRYLESVGFYRRAEGSRGNRFGRLFLEEQGRNRLADIIQAAVPGLRVEMGRMGRRVVTTRANAGGRCTMGIYLDNAPLPGFDIDTYPLDWVEALETYERMDVPFEYNNSCGVILLWSRRSE